MYMYANDNSADQHALLCSPTITIRDNCLNAYFHLLFTFMLRFDAIRVGLFKILSRLVVHLRNGQPQSELRSEKTGLRGSRPGPI